ncbi:hypothetical protein ME1_00819 [Bartonella vinsonii subsp. arupensis OK-94-513]|uniref:Phage tail collar domain-containing protein n=1 Tax=Bartonella vinsonii subsp. arupensis OK-94-513 TaxID=1094562 RepID=J1JU83_BARVI|nr:phage tail protein [Bartonella vinsonii]EJF88055.1 hypothetical protein ME1_00819 [Bartonella vinsonii subsp. arupensis OK-94-513]
MSTIYDWSLRASENTHADNLVNWSEGQLPSTINNSARVMMQRVREYLSDTGGALESTFTIDEQQKRTTIRLQTKSQFKEYKTGIFVQFQAIGTNVGLTTVALNGLEGKPVYKATDSGARTLSGGEIQNGCIYSLVYSDDSWHLLNPTELPLSQDFDSSLYPSGFIGTFGMREVPMGWLLCDGKAYSRSTYSSLFEAIGTVWGEGDGVETFHVPDLRGMFLRGFDDSRNIDTGRSFASVQTDLMQSHQHSGQTLSLSHFSDHENYWHGNTTDILGYRLRLFGGGMISNFTGIESENIQGYIVEPYSLDDRQDVVLERSGEGETRPINVSVVFAIKT